MSFTIILDSLLILCLVAGIALVVRMGRMFQGLRTDKTDMENILATLTTTIRQAETTMRTWRLSTQELASSLDPMVEKAQLVRDELALLTASGDQIASRLTEVATVAARQTAAIAPAVFTQKSIEKNTVHKPTPEPPTAMHPKPSAKPTARTSESSSSSSSAPRSQPRSETERDLLRLLMQKRREAS